MEEITQKMCFTIGHSNHSIDNFLKLLKKWKIEYLLDVRSKPYSKYAEQFNKEKLVEQLRNNGFQYRYLGNKIGGSSIRFHDSSQDVPKLKQYRNKKEFKDGIKILYTFILKKKKIAIMCSEKDPFNCHRFFLIAYCLQKKDVKVNHILFNGEIIENRTLEKKLKDNISQKTLTGYNEKEKNLDDLYEDHYLKIFKKFSEQEK